MFNLVSPVNKAFATRNGLEYITDNTRRHPNRVAGWEKISWLLALLPTLEEGTLVVYEDCDSINNSGDITKGLSSNSDFGMIQIRQGFGRNELGDWYNDGVIFMINSPELRSFLSKVMTLPDENDEAAVLKVLKSTDYTVNGKRIHSMDPSWNCWNNNEHLCNEINIKSFHGLSYEHKLQQIKEFLNK